MVDRPALYRQAGKVSHDQKPGDRMMLEQVQHDMTVRF